MSQSVYSWYGTRLHLVLEDDFADAFNRAQKAWFQAQVDHEARTGQKWDPVNEPIWIKWDAKESKAFDDMGRLINLLIEINGGSLDITEEDMTSDYLVKIV